jgi:hypothetical protein
MDAKKMASGRSPSIETITTRCVEDTTVGVIEGEGVCDAVGIAVCVAVIVCVAVAEAVKVGARVGVDVRLGVDTGRDSPGALDIWQASRRKIEKRRKLALCGRWFFMKCILYDGTITDTAWMA